MKQFKYIYKFSLFTFLLFLSTYNLISQNIRFEHINTDDGLGSNSINCIFQDSKGFIWIGTADGLNKFDGRKFTIYRNDPYDSTSISDNTIFNILEDRDGFLWISTNKGGLNRFDRNNERFIRFIHDPNNLNSISFNTISAICIDTSNNIWISTDMELQKYDKTLNKFIKKTIFSSYYNSMITGSDGNIWYLNGFLQKFDTQKNTLISFTRQSGVSLSLFEDKERILWAGGKEELYCFDKHTEKFECFKIPKNRYDKEGVNRIRSISEYENGILWLGTWGGGLFRFNKKTHQFTSFKNNPTDPNSISNDNVYSTLVDKTGTLWVGTYGGGIDKYSDFSNKFNQIIYNPLNKTGLNDPFIFPLTEDGEAKLYIGTFSGGLNIFDRKTGQFKYLFNKSNKNLGWSNSITCLLEAEKNILWIGTTDGLFIFNKNNRSIKRFENLIRRSDLIPSNKYAIPSDMKVIYKDIEGIIWFGTRWSGLIKYDPKSKKIKQYLHNPNDPASINDREVTSIYEDKKGVLWVGTFTRGLNKFDRKNGKFLHYINDQKDFHSISHNYIKTIFEDSHGKLWIGTAGGGLNKMILDKTDDSDNRTEIFEHYTHKDGLANDDVYGILEDINGNLWISTNNGLSKFNPESKTFRNYYVGDGLINNEFNTMSFFKNLNGEMFFGSMGGVIYFDPEEITDNPYIPSIVITSLKIFDREIKKDIFKDDEVHLSYNENFVYLEFAALDFTNPKKNQYSYKLEGIDKEWINCGNRSSASYPNLSSGEYKFKVMGSNSDEIWNKKGVSLNIIIFPPPWKTWWAYCIYIISFFGILFWFLRYKSMQQKLQINRIKEQSKSIVQTQEDERKRISRELHDSVNQLLISTKFKIDLLESPKENEAKEVKELIDNAIEEVRDISNNLHPIILDDLGLLGAILNLSKKFKARTNKNVEIEAKDFPKHLSPQIQINLYRIIQEAFNNIEKHSDAIDVSIIFHHDESFYFVKIKDNGKGFDIQSTRHIENGKVSYGLHNMKERINFLNGTIEINSFPGKGTEIVIRIPIKS